jgi:cyclic pyranopterin phosphate synthase
MIDITGKPEVYREATATGHIRLRKETIRLIKEGKTAKGDALHTAKIAGILAAKETSALIPLCHPLPLTNVEIEIGIKGSSSVRVTSTVKTRAQTGVEMEALTATAAALLTVWDMVKQYEKDAWGQYPATAIESIRVIKKVKKSIGEKVSKHERKRKKAQGSSS